MNISRYYAWLFSAPALMGLLAFVGFPFLLAIGLSFTNYKLGSPLPLRFVGLTQYAQLFADQTFLRAMLNNVTFALVLVPLQTALALALAILLNQKLKSIVIARSLFFTPVVFPMSLVAVIWILFFAPGDNGIINFWLHNLSFGQWQALDFLREPTAAFIAVVITSIWQGVGFQMVIFLAGLQSIPPFLYEAARLDGANRWQQFVHVTVPQLYTTIVFVALMTTILAFRIFDQVRIMTQGGPHDATTTVVLESVKASFDQQKIASASAMTVIFFVFVLVVSLAQKRLMQDQKI